MTPHLNSFKPCLSNNYIPPLKKTTNQEEQTPEKAVSEVNLIWFEP